MIALVIGLYASDSGKKYAVVTPSKKQMNNLGRASIKRMNQGFDERA
jgi:hypothetical protein